MLLRQVGELGLLKEIRRRFRAPETGDGGVIVGIGDDAAAFSPERGSVLVTTDLMAEGVHFDLGLISPRQLGFKLVSVNVSDIMAMAGKPRYLFLSLALREACDESLFWSLFDGIAAGAARYGLSLLGGDLSGARNDMVLSATVIGSAVAVVTRGGACPGDGIYVTGNLGDSACGLEVLRRLTDESRQRVSAHEFAAGPERAGSYTSEAVLEARGGPVTTSLPWAVAEPLLRRHLTPEARDTGFLAGKATAMIDLSDGLFVDLSRVCDESGCGASIRLDAVPLSDEMKESASLFGLDPWSLATKGGEDYEILFTSAAPPEELSAEGLAVNCIGTVTDGRRTVIDADGVESEMKPEGYQHFGA